MKKSLLLGIAFVLAFQVNLSAQEEEKAWKVGGAVGVDFAQMFFVNPKFGAGEDCVRFHDSHTCQPVVLISSIGAAKFIPSFMVHGRYVAHAFVHLPALRTSLLEARESGLGENMEVQRQPCIAYSVLDAHVTI